MFDMLEKNIRTRTQNDFKFFFFFFFEMTTVPALESFQYMAVPILFEIGKIIGIVLGAPVSWQTFMQQL